MKKNIFKKILKLNFINIIKFNFAKIFKNLLQFYVAVLRSLDHYCYHHWQTNLHKSLYWCSGTILQSWVWRIHTMATASKSPSGKRRSYPCTCKCIGLWKSSSGGHQTSRARWARRPHLQYMATLCHSFSQSTPHCLAHYCVVLQLYLTAVL